MGTGSGISVGKTGNIVWQELKTLIQRNEEKRYEKQAGVII